MVLEHSFTNKVSHMLVNGNKIKWMERELYTILITKLPIRVIGKMISFMDMVLYIMNKSLSLLGHSNIKIGKIFKNIG
jgi:hypothetical protein